LSPVQHGLPAWQQGKFAAQQAGKSEEVVAGFCSPATPENTIPSATIEPLINLINMEFLSKKCLEDPRALRSEAQSESYLRHRAAAPAQEAGAIRGSTTPNALEKMRGRTLRILRERRRPPNSRCKGRCHFAHHGWHGDRYRARLLDPFSG
jgi:hypothetical protein